MCLLKSPSGLSMVGQQLAIVLLQRFRMRFHFLSDTFKGLSVAPKFPKWLRWLHKWNFHHGSLVDR